MTSMLVLGGTGWLGPELIRRGLSRGWSVSSLTRGKSGEVPDGAQTVTGDRTADDGYDAVRDQDWDVVVDTTWQPGMVRSAVAALAGRAATWVFVSSNGAYADLNHPGPADDRNSLVDAFSGDHAEAADYRGAKVACEQAVLGARGSDCLIVRSGLLIGPGDISDRLGYWVGRFRLAGDDDVLVPAAQDPLLQAIDVRDLAEWIVAAAARQLTGTYDVVGPRYNLRELIDVSRHVAGFRGRCRMASDDFLRSHGVRADSGGPMTLPLWDPRSGGYPLVSAGPVLSEGIAYRPLAETITDSLADEEQRGLTRDRRAGLTREQELGLLDELTASESSP